MFQEIKAWRIKNKQKIQEIINRDGIPNIYELPEDERDVVNNYIADQCIPVELVLVIFMLFIGMGILGFVILLWSVL